LLIYILMLGELWSEVRILVEVVERSRWNEETCEIRKGIVFISIELEREYKVIEYRIKQFMNIK